MLLIVELSNKSYKCWYLVSDDECCSFPQQSLLQFYWFTFTSWERYSWTQNTEMTQCVLINIHVSVWHFSLYLERRHWHWIASQRWCHSPNPLPYMLPVLPSCLVNHLQFCKYSLVLNWLMFRMFDLLKHFLQAIAHSSNPPSFSSSSLTRWLNWQCLEKVINKILL